MATLPAPPTDHSARRGLSAPLVGLLCVLPLLAAACAPAEDAAEPAAGSTAGATPEDGPGTPTPAETGPGDSDVAAGTPDAATSGADGIPADFSRVEGVTTTAEYEVGEGLDAWLEEVPEVQDVRIPSSADDHEQPALWLPPAAEGDGDASPLLVVLHSWSYGYQQHYGIP